MWTAFLFLGDNYLNMTHPIMPTYNRLAVTFERGEGVWLWDDNGKRYLDALSGIAVCGLGHAHPVITKAITDQAGKLLHTSNLYGIEHQQKLAEKLIEISNLDNVFFSNSGAEANEAAIKIARRYGHAKGIERPTIIVTDNSFHGRTLATLSATGNPKVQEGFAPLVEGFSRVPYDDIEAIRQQADDKNIVAVLVEPVQGEGGVHIPSADYLKQLRQLCDEQGWLLMLDEIQTGVGRTGRWFAYQHAEILPDVCTLAKALGNGVPMGACLARGQAAQMLSAGTHGSTFGGNPLACRTALAVLNVIEQEQLLARVTQLSRYLLAGFHARLDENAQVMDIRGLGLMIGIELKQPCTELMAHALEQGILINVTAQSTIRLLPPLILNDTDADLLIELVTALIVDFTENNQA